MGGIHPEGCARELLVFAGPTATAHDKLQANIGAPSSHSFPNGYNVVGYYHTHPNVSPDQADITTGGVFSQGDENYARAYHLDANVMLIWNDTSLGTSNTKTADFSREYSDPPAPSSTAKSISNAGC
jgi:hypothetical protein